MFHFISEHERYIWSVTTCHVIKRGPLASRAHWVISIISEIKPRMEATIMDGNGHPLSVYFSYRRLVRWDPHVKVLHVIHQNFPVVLCKLVPC